MVTFSPLKFALDIASAILTSVNLARCQLFVSVLEVLFFLCFQQLALCAITSVCMWNVGICNTFCYSSKLYIEEVYWGGTPEFMWNYPVLNLKKAVQLYFSWCMCRGNMRDGWTESFERAPRRNAHAARNYSSIYYENTYCIMTRVSFV
jgi:hypothetical protein